MAELTGRIAVVTGAASGIGRAIGLELADAGADVVVHTRQLREAAAEVVTQIEAMGRQARLILADLADESQQDRLAAEAWDAFGRIDVLVNNAGTDVLTGRAAHWSFEQKLAQLWRVDVVATMRLTRQIGRRMREAGRGAILNIGWDQATHGMAGDSGELFAATKGAVMAFTKSAALSLAPQVRVNCLAPGWIKTAWGERASEAWQERATREAQLGRWGTPEDVAAAARFFCSDESSFLDGQVLNVDGGYRPR
jgi:3-oxoacyl-[acyl-carrier protein] reductase